MSLKKILANVIKKTMGYHEIEFKVAGCTFKNGRKTRQAIIRAIKWHDEPFEKECKITFERYDYEGSLAISVLANGLQIGNVPKDLVPEFDRAWVSEYIVETYKVLGDGGDIPFGFRIKVLFNNK